MNNHTVLLDGCVLFQVQVLDCTCGHTISQCLHGTYALLRRVKITLRQREPGPAPRRQCSFVLIAKITCSKRSLILGSWFHYCKTPLISTNLFSGLATEQVLIFGAVLTFGGYDKAEAKILQGRSLFNPVLSAHNTLLRMFQRLCTYFQDTGVLIFGGGGGGGYVLSGHCNQQQISVKTEGVLIFGGVLIYGVLR